MGQSWRIDGGARVEYLLVLWLGNITNVGGQRMNRLQNFSYCRQWLAVFAMLMLVVAAQPAWSASRAVVTEVQSQLIELGYLSGSADGIAGRGTRQAIPAEARAREKAMSPVRS